MFTGAFLLEVEFLTYVIWAGLKLLVPLFFVLEGPEAAKAVWELKQEDISVIGNIFG